MCPVSLNGCGSVQTAIAETHVFTAVTASTWIAKGKEDRLPVHCAVRLHLSPSVDNIAMLVGLGFSKFNLLVPPAAIAVLIKLIIEYFLKKNEKKTSSHLCEIPLEQET